MAIFAASLKTTNGFIRASEEQFRDFKNKLEILNKIKDIRKNGMIEREKLKCLQIFEDGGYSTGFCNKRHGIDCSSRQVHLPEV